jgi:hypothetical protein
MLTKIMPKKSENYSCKKCHFECCKLSNYNAHILTRKHKILTNTDTEHAKNAEIFNCDCGKEYKHRQSLFKHKKICTQVKIEETDIGKNITPELIIEIIKQNQELQKQNNEIQKQNNEIQKQMMEVIKNGTNNTINTNSNNKTKFNLNFFLNETCKDAMNITDFVSSLKLQLSDLENVGKNGYVNGISNIIVKNLNALEVNKRPVHCSDLKREIMYVKDENKWEKEKEKLKTAVKKISYKNVLKIQEWQKEHPGCQYSHNRQNDEYLQILNESMGALTEEEKIENINKIIKNVAKEVVIEKEAE